MDAKKMFYLLVEAQGGQVNDQVANVLLRRAMDDIAGICNCIKPPKGTSSSTAELALIYYNRLGAEGEKNRSEGDIAYAFEQGIPKNIIQRLKMYNKGKVV